MNYTIIEFKTLEELKIYCINSDLDYIQIDNSEMFAHVLNKKGAEVAIVYKAPDPSFKNLKSDTKWILCLT